MSTRVSRVFSEPKARRNCQVASTCESEETDPESVPRWGARASTALGSVSEEVDCSISKRLARSSADNPGRDGFCGVGLSWVVFALSIAQAADSAAFFLASSSRARAAASIAECLARNSATSASVRPSGVVSRSNPLSDATVLDLLCCCSSHCLRRL